MQMSERPRREFRDDSLAAAESARAEIGIVRVPPEAEHWAAIDKKVREALGDEAYEAAHAQGAEMSTEEALEWAKRCPDPMPGEESELEIRPVFEAEDFGKEFTPELRAQEDRLRSEIERQQRKS